MSFKTILVCLNEVRRLDETINAAIILGRAFEAHVTALFVVPAAPFYVSFGIQAVATAFEAQHKYFEANAEKARSAFEAAMQREGIAHDFLQVNSKNSLVWDEIVDNGLSADLILLSQTHRDIEKSVEDYYAEEAVMRTGRPVILLPYKGDARLSFDTIVVGWKGRRESARAVFDALPILKLANKVQVVSIGETETGEDGTPKATARIIRTLSRHKVPAIAVVIPADGADAGRTLMRHAAKIGAGLTVMGAYGHARNREYVFGGATFEMFLNMNRPVLMSN